MLGPPPEGVLPRLLVVGVSGSLAAALLLARAAMHRADVHQQLLHTMAKHLLHRRLPACGKRVQASQGKKCLEGSASSWLHAQP